METITLRKKGSALALRIFADPKDTFFSFVQLVTVRTGHVKASHYILTSDVPQWQGMYSCDGYHPVKEEATK